MNSIKKIVELLKKQLKFSGNMEISIGALSRWNDIPLDLLSEASKLIESNGDTIYDGDDGELESKMKIVNTFK